MTSAEAGEMTGLQYSSINQSCRRGRYNSARQSGSTWIIARAEIELRHGEASVDE